MSTLNADHNHYALDQQQQSSQPPARDPATQDLHPVPNSSSILPLPANAYSPSAKRPKVATSFSNGAYGKDGDSPDPHDFYRRHQEQFGRGSNEGLGQGGIRVERIDFSMGNQQRPSPTSRINGSRLPIIPSRINTQNFISSKSPHKSPLSAAKSSPTLNDRRRQTSLRDLVDKFNHTPDEQLPMPRKSTSRSTSTGSNPSNRAHMTKARASSSSARSDNPSVKNGLGSGSSSSKGTATPHSRRGRTNEDVVTSARSKRTQRTASHDYADPRQSASQSMTNLAPNVDNPEPRPLFGEVFTMRSNQADPGYGINAGRRRRGSEGSMHSPNPMFPAESRRQASEMSPSSPSGWYLSAIPTLNEIKTERKIPDSPTNMHRRTRSDYAGVHSGPPTSTVYGADLSPSRDPPLYPDPYNSQRNPQSRIPISTRRLSMTSDSGNSTPSTRNNSALGKAHVQSPTRTAVVLKKNTRNPRSQPKHSRSSTPQRSPRRADIGSPRRADIGSQRLATSPGLAAYISAPTPKESPPLRSSRPRQPVSSASTSASRARAADRLSGHENGSPRSTRESRTRKQPELGGVDFAARREKIQRAFTQTVKENERQEAEAEQRRMSMAQEHQPLEALNVDGSSNVDSNEVFRHDPGEDACRILADQRSKSERELTINTGHLSERSVLDLSLEDSPTLGTFDRFAPNLSRVQEGDATPPSDVEPASAITNGTSDSVDTFFDDEPQEDSQDTSQNPSQGRQRVIDHVMHMRGPSPNSRTDRRATLPEESASEKDDQESIQIMLGDTPICEKAASKEQYGPETKHPHSGDEPESRWSMSSWTSSARSRDDRDAPMERIDEHSPSGSTPPAHIPVSTSRSDQTPQQAWSPATFASQRTARTTMDSDTYSTINHVLDHYHDPSVVSPELMQDVQQQILIQSPDLARQGGWDSKRVTQLYLQGQKLAKDIHSPSSPMPDPLRFQNRTRTSSLGVPFVPEKEVREDHDEKMVEQMEREHQQHLPSSSRLDVDDGELNPARASLTRPDDWDMSPSQAGIDLQAEATDTDSPIEEKPTLPPKDGKALIKGLAEMPDAEGNRLGQPAAAADSGPQIPPIKPLGLAINIMPPQKNEFPVSPPPLPCHSPPPPPIQFPGAMRSPPSPSVYSIHPSSAYPSKAPIDDDAPPVPPLPTSSSSRPSRSVDSFRQPSGSSTVSQEQRSVDGPSFSTDVTSKSSSPPPEQKRLNKRRYIIKELVDTEHSFGQDMKVVDDIYKGTASDLLNSEEDVKTLFGNSGQIVAFSTNFLDALKAASKSVYVLPKEKRWRSNRVSNATSYSGITDDQSSIHGVELSDEEKDRKTFIGETFGHHMRNMEKVYAEYLKNHDAANQKLQALQQIPKVQIWLKECRAYAHDLTSAWDLDSMLVKPVQRILKYPLLLEQLLEVTPEKHPDYSALDMAAREIKEISMRINEMKRRADIMEQVTNKRQRKESDVRLGLSKAFGRRTEKLRQQVGLSDTVQDKAYTAVVDKFGSHFFQLQVVMRDVEMYTNDVQVFMNRFCDFALAMEGHIDVGQTSYPEIESKWRKFRMVTREMSRTALTDHVSHLDQHSIHVDRF